MVISGQDAQQNELILLSSEIEYKKKISAFNDLEEDEDHHLPHPNTDQDDHEIEDEFDEDMIEEEEDDGGVNPASEKAPNRLARQA